MDDQQRNKELMDQGWNAMHQLLDQELPQKNKKRRLVWWWTLGSVAAAVLFLLFTFPFRFSSNEPAPPSITQNETKLQRNQPQNKPAQTTASSVRTVVDNTKSEPTSTPLPPTGKSITQQQRLPEQITANKTTRPKWTALTPNPPIPNGSEPLKIKPPRPSNRSFKSIDVLPAPSLSWIEAPKATDLPRTIPPVATVKTQKFNRVEILAARSSPGAVLLQAAGQRVWQRRKVALSLGGGIGTFSPRPIRTKDLNQSEFAGFNSTTMDPDRNPEGVLAELLQENRTTSYRSWRVFAQAGVDYRLTPSLSIGAFGGPSFQFSRGTANNAFATVNNNFSPDPPPSPQPSWGWEYGFRSDVKLGARWSVGWRSAQAPLILYNNQRPEWTHGLQVGYRFGG